MKKIMATAILTLSSSSLFATSIQHTGIDWNRGLTVQISADGKAKDVSAGVGVLLVDGTNLIDAFCVNLFTGISVNQTYAAVAIDSADYDVDGPSAAWLVQNFLPLVNAASGVTRQIEGAALQLAIWDTIHDGGDGFAAGRIRSTGSTTATVLALAEQWSLAAVNQNGTANVYTAAPGARAFQQQIFLPVCTDANGCQSGGEVPEPSTIAMMLIGGAGVLFGSWRRRANAAE